MTMSTAEKFSALATKMKKFSKSTSIICTERVFLYPADQNTKENGVKWGFRQRRKKFSSKQHKWRECRERQPKTYMWRYWKKVKNDQKTGVQKGSKMAKNEGLKKGQKRAKNQIFRTLKSNEWKICYDMNSKEKKATWSDKHKKIHDGKQGKRTIKIMKNS
jgi:hypothetical protein